MTDTGFTPLIATHAVAATLALVLGAVNVLRTHRGDRPHRMIGTTWVVLMYFVAASSFGIQDLRPDHYSWIHVLSAFTLVTLTLGLVSLRRSKPRWHAGHMIGSYIGLVGALVGVVVVPDRMVPTAFQQSWLTMTALTAGGVAAGLVFVAAVVAGVGDGARGRAGHARPPPANRVHPRHWRR